MDNTHIVIHPNERVIYRRNEDHFLKGLTKLFTKKITNKAAKQAGLSEAQTAALQSQVKKATTTGALGAKIKSLNKQGNIIAGAGLTALTAGLATGAIPLGAGAASAGAGATAVGASLPKPVTAATKIATITSDQIKNKIGDAINKAKETNAGKIAEAIANQLPESVKQNIRNKGQEILSDIVGNQTSAELLPKTRPQKQLETMVRSNRALSEVPSPLSLSNPLVIGGVLVAILFVILAMRK